MIINVQIGLKHLLTFCHHVFSSEPYTTYKIWVDAVMSNSNRTQPSQHILANTDVDQVSDVINLFIFVIDATTIIIWRECLAQVISAVSTPFMSPFTLCNLIISFKTNLFW
jgi:hypothetical protein